MRILRLTVVLCFVSTCMAVSVHAQTSRPGSETENMVLSAVTRLNANDIDGAKEVLSALLAQDAENDAAWYYLAMASLSLNEMAEAEEYLKRAVSLDPDNFWYRYRLAGIYGTSQRQELTIDMYEKLLEDFPKRSELYLDMMELYATQGEYEKALDTIEEVETVFGMNEPLAMYRFNLLRSLGKHEEAYASLEKYNEEYSSPYVLSTLADWQILQHLCIMMRLWNWPLTILRLCWVRLKHIGLPESMMNISVFSIVLFPWMASRLLQRANTFWQWFREQIRSLFFHSRPSWTAL